MRTLQMTLWPFLVGSRSHGGFWLWDCDQEVPWGPLKSGWSPSILRVRGAGALGLFLQCRWRGEVGPHPRQAQTKTATNLTGGPAPSPSSRQGWGTSGPGALSGGALRGVPIFQLRPGCRPQEPRLNASAALGVSSHPPPRVATVVPEAVIWGWRRTGMVPKRPRPYVRAPGSAGPCVGECGRVAPCTCADVAVHAADDKSEGHWVPVLTKQDWPCPPGAPGPRKGADKNQIPLERGGLSGPVAREVERGQLTSSEGSGGDSQSVTCGKSMPDSGNSTH